MARETVRIDGLDDVLRRLKALGAEAQKRGGPVAKGVRAGGKVIAEAAKANVRQIIATPNVGGIDKSTGKLEKSIRVMRAKAHRSLKGETYIVAPNRRSKYPSGESVASVARMLEYGTPRRQPMPFMRPAFHDKKAEAAKAMVDETTKGIAAIERKLSKR